MAGKRRLRRLLTLVLLAGLLAVVASPAVSPALAGSETYCSASYASGASCYGPRHSLRRNYALNYYGDSGYYEAAAAYDVNLNPYGTWVYGWGSACHSYSGANLLYPRLYNPDSRGQSIYGVQYYGSESACP